MSFATEGCCKKRPLMHIGSRIFSKKIKRLVKLQFDEDLRIVHATEKVGNRFTLKDETPKEVLSKVVYLFRYPSDLDAQYIGFTTRPLQERVNEHRRRDTAIAEHVERCKSCTKDTINIGNFSVLKKCRTNMEARINEAILINRKNPKLNV